jgi:heme-degrading monooxygenase HmoA
MSAQWKHKRYFRIRGYEDGSTYALKTFSSVEDAKTKIGFKSVYDTSSPTKTEALEDGNQTLVVTYEFASEPDQTAFKTALDGAYGTGTESDPSQLGHFTPAVSTDKIEHFKTEWLHEDGTVSASIDL